MSNRTRNVRYRDQARKISDHSIGKPPRSEPALGSSAPLAYAPTSCEVTPEPEPSLADAPASCEVTPEPEPSLADAPASCEARPEPEPTLADAPYGCMDVGTADDGG